MDIGFEPSTHTYTLDGVVVPSVTQVLSLLEDWSHVNPEVLEAARVFGDHVHSAVHLWNTGELDWGSLDPPLVKTTEQWAQFIEDNDITIIASEVIVAHPLLKYAGRKDTLVEWDRRRCLIDVKSGLLPRTVGPQTDAYKEAHHAMHKPCVQIARRHCVQINPEWDRAKVTRLNSPSDFSIFVSALNCWRFKNGH